MEVAKWLDATRPGHTSKSPGLARATAPAFAGLVRVKFAVPGNLGAWLAKECFPRLIKMYSKSRRRAPIYWQLSTPSASYSVWLYIHAFNKDTLFRIHGTNHPELIGEAISSGCIRMTNEDVIDLYSRVKTGALVVVLEPKAGDSPYNSKLALQGGGGTPY